MRTVCAVHAVETSVPTPYEAQANTYSHSSKEKHVLQGVTAHPGFLALNHRAGEQVSHRELSAEVKR